MTPSLSVVADAAGGKAEGRAQETVSQRVRRLQAEARGLAREHIGELERLLLEVERTSAEIAEGGEAYPAGVRDIARRLAEDCEAKLQTLEAIVSRSH
jgi:hypothetical protein